MTTPHARIATTAAVTSALVTAATVPFAWCFSRFTETEGYRYCAPLVVYGTVWLLSVVFAVGVVWSLAEQVGRWLDAPAPPRPTRPPEQPKPQDTPRPAPGPIQPIRPKPGQPPRRVETTLVDMEPVVDITQELPRVVDTRLGPFRSHLAARVPHHLHIPPGQSHLSEWRPPVSHDSKEDV